MRAQSYPHTLSSSPYLKPEKYLHVINSFWARKHLAIEKGRHAKLERHRRICNMCNLGCVEDEYHFILICPKF